MPSPSSYITLNYSLTSWRLIFHNSKMRIIFSVYGIFVKNKLKNIEETKYNFYPQMVTILLALLSPVALQHILFPKSVMRGNHNLSQLCAFHKWNEETPKTEGLKVWDPDKQNKWLKRLAFKQGVVGTVVNCGANTPSKDGFNASCFLSGGIRWKYSDFCKKQRNLKFY